MKDKAEKRESGMEGGGEGAGSVDGHSFSLTCSHHSSNNLQLSKPPRVTEGGGER